MPVICKTRSVSVQTISRAKVKQEVIDLKDELQTVKRGKSENPSKNEFMSNQWDQASPAEKLGINV